MEQTATYDINFFKPRTAFLKENVRLITISVLVWAIAVFGFHILLKVIEKPTPEPAYLTYEKVWAKKQSATVQEQKDLAKVYLTLTGKYIPLRANPAVRAGFSTIVYNLLPERDKLSFFRAASGEGEKVDRQMVAALLGIENGLLKEAIPFTVGKFDPAGLGGLEEQIPPIMDKYLIHNRSVLTDTKFFGFPFHYFYTAVFLKVLFCLICLIYCNSMDKIMKNHGLEAVNE
jgi:uncharacterized membrane protein